MADRYAFTDEAGCFTFARRPNVSRYFIICSVTMTDLSARAALQNLREQLLWEGVEIGDFFHATSDKQAVRDRVFACILELDFRVQAQICEKSKAQPGVRDNKARFYKYPLFYLFKHGIGPHLQRTDRLIITAASIGHKKERATYVNSLDDVMAQTLRTAQWKVDFRPSQCDPCLQIADYCCWAIQRKWESGGADVRSYNLIRDRISYEYDMWAHGRTHYY